MRLDNRPKAVAVVFPNSEDFNEGKDEALKQYLLFVSGHQCMQVAPSIGTNQHFVQSDLMESASISAHPERGDAAVVAFKERYKAEQFLGAAGKEIPHIGKCELTWVPNSQLSGVAAATVAGAAGSANGGNGTNMEGSGGPDVHMGEEQHVGRAVDVNYDVADDDDRWLG